MFKSLTSRELEIGLLIIEGKTNKEIANVLIIEECTVKVYIKRSLKKLGIRNRVQFAIGLDRELRTASV